MQYVMIAVFPIDELADVLKEFVSSGKVTSVKPSYEAVFVEEKPEQAKKRGKHPIGHDRALLLNYFSDSGDVGYDDIISSDLGITEKSLVYNLNYLIDRGQIVRIGEKPYRYQISKEKDE